MNTKKMTKAEIRTTLDNALMESEVIRFRRNNNLFMRGWQKIGENEGVKIVINVSAVLHHDLSDYDDFYNVITLTEDGKFKVNIWDNKHNCLSDCIERENEYREDWGDELLHTEFENIIDALSLGYDIVDTWDLEED